MVWKQIRKDLNSCPQGVRQKDYFNFKLFLGDLSSHLGLNFFLMKLLDVSWIFGEKENRVSFITQN